MVEEYDYIITGAGAAGLSLLVRMIRSGEFSHQKILLIDKAPKTQNDRTWCFWEKGEGLFEEIVCRQWDKLWFHGKDHSRLMDIRPYRYKMIRGIDFYRHCFGLIAQHDHIKLQYGQVESVHSDAGGTFVIADGKKITARYIFNSIPGTMSGGRWNLLQHFKGWVIETPRPAFHPEEAILMDFRTSQQAGAAFVYTMPFSHSRALVEYTLFSEKLSTPQEYEEGLKDYIRSKLQIGEYTILEQESGVIPMTDHDFPVQEQDLLYIGTAGGQTKASSGYTFQFIQRQSREIVQALAQTGKLPIHSPERRFRFYDSVLLNVLASGKLPGEKVFTRLFCKNKIGDLFNFLDNDSSLSQDLRIIGSLPVLPFLKAGFQELIRRG